jgi:hypothetical protein
MSNYGKRLPSIIQVKTKTDIVRQYQSFLDQQEEEARRQIKQRRLPKV